MRGLKPFVQEAVQALAPAQLRLLAETLRVDLRGCDDRDDLERVLTGLVCLDQDTSLGVFLTWLRAADQHGHGLLASKKPAFNNTFLPAITSSEPAIHSDNNRKKSTIDQRPSEHVKDHHLGEEITQQLKELAVLETSFKQAERLVHTGTPTFEKLKKFLLELAALRAKEQSARAFLVRQASVLQKKHDEMRAETLHTRAQLDFFVEGFTNLRRRHDALLQDATRIKAEHETAQELFIGMSAHDCYFEQLMRNTLWKQIQDNAELQRQLDQAHSDLDAAAQKRRELEQHISALKQARGDARKDAHCSKRQLRLYKQRLQHLQQAGGGADGSFFRRQAVVLRQSVATLASLLRDAVIKDTKSQRQTMSKEALRVLQQVLTPGTSEMAPLPPPSKSFKSNVSYNKGASQPEDNNVDLAEPRVFQRAGADVSPDLDEVIRGVLLVEGATQGDAEECAKLMGQKLKYLPVDVKQTLITLRRDEENAAKEALEKAQRQREERVLEFQQQAASVGGQGLSGDGEQSTVAPSPSVEPPVQLQPTPAETVDLRPPPPLEEYVAALKLRIASAMAAQDKRGFVMYNWPFTRNDVNLLQGAGLPIDSIINLEDPTKVAPVITSTSETPVASTVAAASSASSASTTAPLTAVSTPASPAKSASSASTPKSRAPSRPGAKTTTPSAGARGKTLASPQKAPGKASASPSKAPPRKASPSKVSPNKSSPSKAAPKSPAKPASRASSPTRTTSGAKKRPAATPSTGISSQPSPAPPTPAPASSQEQRRPTSGSKAAKKKVAPPTAASRLQGLGSLLQPVEPSSFPAERVAAILQVLEQQKRRKLAPVVKWDESTCRTNELLAMWAEEIHMLLYQEQENRKPKKTTEPSAPAPSASSTGKTTPASPSRAASPSKTTSSSSRAESRSKLSSPVRTAAGKRSVSPSNTRTASPGKTRPAKK